MKWSPISTRSGRIGRNTRKEDMTRLAAGIRATRKNAPVVTAYALLLVPGLTLYEIIVEPRNT
jgi:hypothetical protein